MVHKVKLLIFSLIFFLLCILCINHKNNIETNILKTLLPQNIPNLSDIISLTNKSSSVIKVVFEGDNIEDIKYQFIDEIDKNYFEYDNFNVSDLVNKYLSQPSNFLSDKTKRLLINKKYDEIYQNSIERLYGVSAIQLNSLDKDPYMLSDDFILSNIKYSDSKNSEKYDYLQLKIKNGEGLSPDIVNKKVAELIKIQKKLTSKTNKIYLAGAPVHSYCASKKAVISINLICILSILLIIFLTYYYFKSFKHLIPIALSTTFGMLLGYCAVKLLFSNFQIITMVFSSALIGIGIDYSYHYFFENSNKNFRKNLLFSFLTSAIPFILLYFTGIDLLKQVCIFIVFGLFGIYLTILFIYPIFKLNEPKNSIKINDKLYKIFLSILIISSLFGILRFKFNDTITSLYSPSKNLQKAEILYDKVSLENSKNTQIVVVKGKNIIEQEEKITKELFKNDIDYISISKFLPSKSMQKENFELTKNLYKNNLHKYLDILSKNQIKTLKNITFKPIDFNISNYSFLNDFLIDKNTSLIFIFTDKKLNINNDFSHIVDFKSDIGSYMKKYRKLLLMLFPITITILFLILSFLYDIKSAAKILFPPILGTISAVFAVSLIAGELNLFSIITMFLVLGFTLDYSIFMLNQDNKTKDAILTSYLTTSFSFLLLCFCGFKLLSSMALVLFFGITISYLTGYFILRRKECDKI